MFAFLLPGIVYFFSQTTLYNAAYVFSSLLAAIFFFGFFSRSTGRGVKAASFLAGILYTLIFALELSLLLNHYGIHFSYVLLISLKKYQPLGQTLAVGIFCLSAMVRGKRDMLCVVLCTLSIVACIMPFYPGIVMGTNFMFALTLLYFYFRKLKF
jgi:hypothetical protein